MKKFLLVISSVFCFCVLFSEVAFALHTKEDALALVNQFINDLKGKDAAAMIAAVNTPKEQNKYIKEELYIFLFDKNTKCVGHATNPGLVDKDLSNLKDADGKLFMREITDKVKAGTSEGWIDYRWTNPVSKKIEPKLTYFKEFQGLIVLAGIYKQN